ncbi:MAG TPA: 2-hydroxyacyl-CoA dehydratase, partial [Ramlibacter sp.]|nr:2-hydroxyacyl-CoA dehydratase [Ramlibacter sp.]
PGAVRYVAAEYQRLRGELERKSHGQATDEKLRASIRAYNRNRSLLRARTRIPCEAHNELLEQALAGIRARQRQPQDKPRVVFVGGFCEQPPLEMLEAMDDNCYVVDDDLLIGLRWITDDVPGTGDPIWALAESFIQRSAASPVQHDERKTKEGYLMDMLGSSKAEAAIVTAAKFCEPGLDEQVAWSKHLDQVGVPYLVLEFEEKMTSFEQMAMQLETFAESLLFATA